MATGKGTVDLDFGAFPGASEASVAITGQTSISSTSYAEAWIEGGTATSDHSTDEHNIEPIQLRCGPRSNGVGFTIFGVNANNLTEPGIGVGTRLHGKFKVNWVWSD